MGKTWKRLESPEFTGFAHRIREDRVNRDLIFLGTEMGLFSSLDGGTSWFRMKNNIPWMALVRDIQIHPKTHDMIIGTHGRGIFIIDDISPLRNLTGELSGRDIHFFPSPVQTLTTGQFGGGSVVNGGFTAANPSALPAFQYYLKDRLTSGVVKLEIKDQNGKLIQSLPGSARKGVNRIYWNQRIAPPKTAGGSTKRDISGFVAPQVLPGQYVATLKVGEKSFSQPITMVHDAQSSFSIQDRELQFRTAMELFGIHEALARLVSDIMARQESFTDSLPKLTRTKDKRKLQAAIDSLEVLRETLVPTKQTSLFADVERLRERITEVYVAVCNNEQAPNNLQLARVRELRRQLDEAKARFDGL
jgi:hypothetical protein